MKSKFSIGVSLALIVTLTNFPVVINETNADWKDAI
jgi:hypothetical protein